VISALMCDRDNESQTSLQSNYRSGRQLPVNARLQPRAMQCFQN